MAVHAEKHIFWLVSKLDLQNLLILIVIDIFLSEKYEKATN